MSAEEVDTERVQAPQTNETTVGAPPMAQKTELNDQVQEQNDTDGQEQDIRNGEDQEQSDSEERAV